MRSRHHVWFLSAAMLAVLALDGCAARSVDAYLERGADLARYQRYAWGPVERTTTGDPRLDGNEIFQERIRAAVDKQLAANGFEKIPSGMPDVWVHFHASVAQRIDLSNIEQPQTCEGCRPFIYDAGTLVIDLVDARTDRLLWRGWSESNVEGAVNNQRWMEERIDEGVTRIFEKFPRRIGQ